MPVAVRAVPVALGFLGGLILFATVESDWRYVGVVVMIGALIDGVLLAREQHTGARE